MSSARASEKRRPGAGGYSSPTHLCDHAAPGREPPGRPRIIGVGSELLLGQIVDTTSAFSARQFAAPRMDVLGAPCHGAA